MQKNTSTLSRRKVTAGLAWSVPAVAAVAAAPFAAASPTGCVDALAHDAVKYPGGGHPDGIKQAYGFELTLTNNSPIAVYVNAGSVVVEFENHTSRHGEARLYDVSPCEGGTHLTGKIDALLLQPDESRTYYYLVNNTGNSAEEAGCVKATLGLALGPDVPEGSDLCDDGHVFVENCFTTTPPTAGC